MLIYVAGPLFNAHERWYLEQIAARLEAAGYQTFLPHRDAGDLPSTSDDDRRRVFHADLDAMNACDGCVALLTGADHDSGTSSEVGYLSARGKPCIGITDDERWLNNMLWGFCGEGQHIVRALDALVPLVRQLIPAS